MEKKLREKCERTQFVDICERARWLDVSRLGLGALPDHANCFKQVIDY